MFMHAFGLLRVAAVLALVLFAQSSQAGCAAKGAQERYLLLGKTGVFDSQICGGWLRCSYPQTVSTDQTRCEGQALPITAQELPAILAHYAKSSWRLPTKDELFLLRQGGTDEVVIDQKFFPDTPAGSFWTSEAWDLWQKNQPTTFYTVNFAGRGAARMTMTAMSGFYLRFVNISQ